LTIRSFPAAKSGGRPEVEIWEVLNAISMSYVRVSMARLTGDFPAADGVPNHRNWRKDGTW